MKTGIGRLEAALAAVALLVVLGAATYTVYNSYMTRAQTYTTTTTTTETITATVTGTSPQLCNDMVWNSSFPMPYAQKVPVLLMNASSTGYVCVVFQTAWQGNETLYSSSYSNDYPLFGNGTYQFYSYTPIQNVCTTANSSLSCTQAMSQSFEVTVLPSSVKLTPALNYVTAIFSITASDNSTGFYDEWAPWTGCVGMPLAVGYSASQVSASDFHIVYPTCPVQLLVPVAEYVTGMGFTYVDSQD